MTPRIALLLATLLALAPPAARATVRANAAVDSLAQAERMRLQASHLVDADSVDAAQALLERALGVAERGRPAGALESAKIAGTLANAIGHRARYAEAARWYRASRDSLERLLGPDSVATIITTNNLGWVLQQAGDVIGARREFERVLTSVRRTAPNDTLSIVSAEVALAGALRDLGDANGARALYRHALFGLSATGHADTPFWAGTCHRYAILLRRMNEFDSALVWARRGLDWRLRALGPDDIETGNSFATVGNTLADLGRFDEAAPMLKQSLRVYLARRGPNDPNSITRLISFGNLASARGDYLAAESLFTRVVAGRSAALGARSLGLAEARYDLALAHQLLGRDSLAIAEGLEAADIRREIWLATIPFLDEATALAFTNEFWTGHEIAVDEVAHGRAADSAAVAATWTTVVRLRTLVLDELAARRAEIAAAPAGDARATWDRWTDARRRLSRAVLRGGARDSLARAADSLERAVAERNALVRARQREHAAGWSDIAAALPAGEALVGFAFYGHVDTSSAVKRWQKDLVFEYAAFVLAPGAHVPHVVPLGTAAHVDSLVDRWAAAIERGAPDAAALRRYRAAGEALRRAVWDPVAARLGNARRVYVVPDGALHRVAWETLPAGGERFLLDAPLEIVRLYSERDLVAAAAPAAAGIGLLALGGADFDSAAATPPPLVAANRQRSAAGTCRDFARVRFGALPGAADEVSALATIWHARRHAPATLLTGRAATRDAFLAEAAGHEYLHIATHGFFLGDSCAADSAGPRDPLDRCGLALAGVNARLARGSDAADGLLTGGDIVTLDLHGTEWAVLSACGSGAGEIDRKEGVRGLQRAFRVAGARAVIVSLWPVQDEAARLWMTELYAGRLARGLGTARAARLASRAVLASLRRSGLAPHPRLWGAFVATGDPR